jgi:CRP/FNR family transcriptional regulator, nitrogen fixation regulation protein
MTDFTRADTPAATGLISECTSPSTAEAFEGLISDEHKSLARTIFGLRRGPIRYSRDQTIVIEGEPSEYIFLVISGVVRSFRSFQNGTRSIVSFYLPTELFGLTNHPTHSLTAEAATDANILSFKRSALVSVAKRENQIANFLLSATLTELRRTQEHSLLICRDAKGRLASFLIDLSKRMRTQTCLDLPMSHQDIADHLGLTIDSIAQLSGTVQSTMAVDGPTRRREKWAGNALAARELNRCSLLPVPRPPSPEEPVAL